MARLLFVWAASLGLGVFMGVGDWAEHVSWLFLLNSSR